MNSREVLLKVNSLTKKYKKEELALNINQLTVNKGECIALIGDNGAGKTTLLKGILDLVKVNTGEVEIKGINILENEIWKDYVSAFLSEKMLIPYLKVKEFISFVGKMKGVNDLEIKKFIDKNREFFKEESFLSKEIRHLSQGNKQKAGILGSIIGERELILLDEPYASLDISSKKFLSKKIKDMNVNIDCTFIISSHNLEDVLSVASRVIVLKRGVIVIDERIENIKKQEIEDVLLS